MTIRLGLEALSLPEKVEEKVFRILSERRRLELQLPRLEVVEQVFPSDSNFLLVRVRDADGLYQYLAAHGIIVRNRSRELHCENCLRITVGTVEENDQLLEALSVSH
jgi:histidinol-phosphate aminotransferase